MSQVNTACVERCIICGSQNRNIIGRSLDFEYETCENEFEFCECEDCGHVFLYNRPLPEELNVIYPDDYIPHRFDEHLGPFISNIRKSVQAKKISPLAKHLSSNAIVVDVGPGNGEFLDLLRQHGHPTWDLWGIDFSEAAIRTLEARGFKGVCSRFETAQWTGSPPNAIVMNQLIEHLEDPAAAMQKAFSLLAPGGVLFIETPSTDAWDFRLFRKRYWGGWHTPRHWHLFRAETLSRLAQQVGFETVEVSHILSPNFWLQSVHHMIAERWRSPRLAKLFDVNVLFSLAGATLLDLVQLTLRNKTSNFRLVVRKPATVST